MSLEAKGQASTIAILFFTPIVIATILLFGYILASGAVNTIAFLSESREQAERSKENIAIHVYRGPGNETLIMIQSLWSGETIVDYIVVKQGNILLQKDKTIVIPARGQILLKPSNLMEPLAAYDDDYDAFRQSISGLMLHTLLGNTFSSGWGKP